MILNILPFWLVPLVLSSIFLHKPGQMLFYEALPHPIFLFGIISRFFLCKKDYRCKDHVPMHDHTF